MKDNQIIKDSQERKAESRPLKVSKSTLAGGSLVTLALAILSLPELTAVVEQYLAPELAGVVVGIIGLAMVVLEAIKGSGGSDG